LWGGWYRIRIGAIFSTALLQFELQYATAA